MMEINLLDVAVGLILLAALIRGFSRGLSGEVAGLVALLAAFVAARQFQGAIEPYLDGIFTDRRIMAASAYGAIFLGTLFVVRLVFMLLQRALNMTFASWIDRFLGGFAGAGKALMFLCLVYFVVTMFAPNATLIRTAKTEPLFYSMTNYLREFMPSVFPHNINFPVRIPGLR